MELSITLIIIIITALVSIGGFSNPSIVDQLIFYPPAVKQGQFYRFFSCGLIHADAGHLIFNMLALYLFGVGTKSVEIAGPLYNGVEYQFINIFGDIGKFIYFVMYLLALFFSLLPTYFKQKNN